ncbi:CLUMA_CG017472, isoform A [Clunio marinus]|uniref:CLUMA_CG017472, isoform A n=1 Tax=Clunio marinus TaxID=568069 RepID=A0A1J1IVZ7_9DIPT|nr:CLUMA_CG017472, isoform A [Clunio marinus]
MEEKTIVVIDLTEDDLEVSNETTSKTSDKAESSAASANNINSNVPKPKKAFEICFDASNNENVVIKEVETHEETNKIVVPPPKVSKTLVLNGLTIEIMDNKTTIDVNKRPGKTEPSETKENANNPSKKTKKLITFNGPGRNLRKPKLPSCVATPNGCNIEVTKMEEKIKNPNEPFVMYFDYNPRRVDAISERMSQEHPQQIYATRLEKLRTEIKVHEVKIDKNQEALKNCFYIASTSGPKIIEPIFVDNFIKIVKDDTKQTKGPINEEGAAGLWALNDQPGCSKDSQPTKSNPPPVTEEDWKVFKKFMDPLPTPKSYKELLILNGRSLLPNKEDFVCSLCEDYVFKDQGVLLKGCLHEFCKMCLIYEIEHNHDLMGDVKCPFKSNNNCESKLEDEEIKALLGELYKDFSAKVMRNLQDEYNKTEREEAAAKDPIVPLLMNEETLKYFENYEAFECGICMDNIDIGYGVMLKNCLHKFCKECITGSIVNSDEYQVKCSEIECKAFLQDCEIRSLVTPEDYEKHLEKSLKVFESTSQNVYHCKTPDCRGFIEVDRHLRGFPCPVCMRVNCISCKTIHQGKNCQQYQDEIDPNGRQQRENNATEDYMRNLVAVGDAMWCPKCGIGVMKVSGCDFVTCTSCKLGICWVKKKPRQPFMNSDGRIIDGCHCREKGDRQRCHPKCNFCH